MIRRRRPSVLTHAAALLAVALLALAGVRSAVMQAQAATPWGMAPICSVGAGGGAGEDPRQTAMAACSFCAAAAHAPLHTVCPPLAGPSSFRWRPAALAAPALSRQPSALQPRARGPPIPSGKV